MASAGIIPGIITCLLCGCISAFALYLLSLCATKTQHRRSSFYAVAQLTYPKAAVFFDAAIAIKCLGVSIRSIPTPTCTLTWSDFMTSYLIIIKGLMPNVAVSIYHDLISPKMDPPAWALNGSNWLLIFLLVLAPLCFLRQLNSLRHTSYIGLFAASKLMELCLVHELTYCTVYLVTIVISCYFRPIDGMPTRGEVRLVHFTPNFVSTFPVQVFAFTCAQNVGDLFISKFARSGRIMIVVPSL